MNETVVIIGLGQLGRIFAGGLLRTGHPVIPVNRGDDPAGMAARAPSPGMVLVAVAEPYLHPALLALPPAWRDRVALLQNELLPRDWQAHGLLDPTVISVWFEKKPGMDAKPLLPSPAFGPGADILVAALNSIDLPAHVAGDADTMLWELVRKNLYILTSNICGLEAGGDVGGLWEGNRELAEAVAADVLDIQDWLTGRRHDRQRLMTGLVEAFRADPRHGCAGRSAPGRLARAVRHADEAALAVPSLRRIARRHGLA